MTCLCVCDRLLYHCAWEAGWFNYDGPMLPLNALSLPFDWLKIQIGSYLRVEAARGQVFGVLTAPESHDDKKTWAHHNDLI